MKQRPIRNLVLVLGDQLDHDSPVLRDFDRERDRIWMAEVAEGTTHVWCHQRRIAFFFAAMRHYRDHLISRGLPVIYHEMAEDPERDKGKSFTELLDREIAGLHPEALVVVEPGDYRVREQLRDAAGKSGIPLRIFKDTHFFDTIQGFQNWAKGKSSLVMENYYRHQRKTHRILLTSDDKPEGGAWNFDPENRAAFGKDGPPQVTAPRRFQPDETTRAVLDLVSARFSHHPGSLEDFDLPVTRSGALVWLREFIHLRLACFGDYQDAMWENEDVLFHSRLSCLLNVKLLNPREVVNEAIRSYREGKAPLNSVEGFVRQILGWREFVRGVYWLHMPAYAEMNYFQAELDLPAFYWNGDTKMECVRQAMRNVLRHGYAHHIQRLMVLGLFAQLYGVQPKAFHEWHMAMYLDAIDWVSLPNALGMSQYGDGGIMATKPYCASGNYINRMSNYCGNCRYNPGETTGARACPFTVFYYEFLSRNYDRLKNNRRLVFQIKNLERKSEPDLTAILNRASEIRESGCQV